MCSRRSARSATADGPTTVPSRAVTPESCGDLDTQCPRAAATIKSFYGHRLWGPRARSPRTMPELWPNLLYEERMSGRLGVLSAHARQDEERAADPATAQGRHPDAALLSTGWKTRSRRPDSCTPARWPSRTRAGPVASRCRGHFLSAERADLFNPLVIAFVGDVRVPRALGSGATLIARTLRYRC